MENHQGTIDQMAYFAGEVTEVALATQAAGLRLLAAEMQALAQMMPGLNAGIETAEPATDAEIEADFDNMPV
jgi:hypothetical protein